MIVVIKTGHKPFSPTLSKVKKIKYQTYIFWPYHIQTKNHSKKKKKTKGDHYIWNVLEVWYCGMSQRVPK